MKTLLKTVYLFCVAILLIGCSYTKPYPNMPKKNLTVYTNMKSKRLMTSVDVNLHIWSYKSEKDNVYLGTVNLEANSIMKLGIPEDHWVELIVEFSYSSVLRPSGKINESYFIKTRPGYIYQVDIEHYSNYYNVEIYETDITKKVTQKVSMSNLKD